MYANRTIGLFAAASIVLAFASTGAVAATVQPVSREVVTAVAAPAVVVEAVTVAALEPEVVGRPAVRPPVRPPSRK